LQASLPSELLPWPRWPEQQSLPTTAEHVSRVIACRRRSCPRLWDLLEKLGFPPSPDREETLVNAVAVRLGW